MNPALKICLYLVLTACLAGFGKLAFNEGSAEPQVPGATNQTQGATNPTQGATNIAGTDGLATNAAATNGAATSSMPSQTEDVVGRRKSDRLGRMLTYGFAAFGALVGLGLLVGRDVSVFLATRAEKFVFNDDLVGTHDPEYDEAEEVWKKGNYLEAVQLMRDFLKKNPTEIYAALRIAEIYEKDLANYVAAALEYEEVLKKKLPSERWGWAAIHLANLYSGKLNKAPQAEALLRRIMAEHGKTAAAKKARERLGIPEPVEIAVMPPQPSVEPTKETVPEERQGPKLPPGFRPLK